MIRSLRCKHLAANIVVDGYDKVEACVNNLLIEARGDENGQVDRKFTNHFNRTVGKDTDHYIKLDEVAAHGALCHNTGNLVNRNVLGGMPGCACVPPKTLAEGCTCDAKRILDENGNYSMDKLRHEDHEWFLAIMGGNQWEILDSAIDIEEPDAAHIISTAYNRKNQVAFATGHMEIMRTLVALCTPNPKSNEVPFDPLKKTLLGLFGSLINDPGFVDAYKLVLLSGGSLSQTFKDLFTWGYHFVREEHREWKLESYSVLASYPPRFTSIVKIQLKHAWSQKVASGEPWCIVPPNIAHRLGKAGTKHAWPELSEQIEELSRRLPSLSHTIVSGSTNTDLSAIDKEKEAVKWHSHLEISLISKMIAAPKCDSIEKTREQEKKVRSECAKEIANKRIGLAKLGGVKPCDMAIDVGGSLMEVALKHFNDPTFVKDNDPTLSPAEKISEEKARSLVPKAIPFNPEGQPLAQVEAVPVGKE